MAWMLGTAVWSPCCALVWYCERWFLVCRLVMQGSPIFPNRKFAASLWRWIPPSFVTWMGRDCSWLCIARCPCPGRIADARFAPYSAHQEYIIPIFSEAPFRKWTYQRTWLSQGGPGHQCIQRVELIRRGHQELGAEFPTSFPGPALVVVLSVAVAVVVGRSFLRCFSPKPSRVP